MPDPESRPSGLIIAAVIFWFLAAGAGGTAFVFYQEYAQSQMRTEAMAEEAKTVKAEAVALLGEANKLRERLDNDATEDAAAVATVRSKLDGAPHIAAALAGTNRRIRDLEGQLAMLESEKARLQAQHARAQREKTAVEATMKAQIQDAESRIAAHRRQVDERVSDLNEQRAKLTKQIDTLDAQTTSEQDAMRTDEIDYRRQLKILIAQRDELKAKLRLVLEYRPRPAGRVLGANMALDFAFVNLGRSHGVHEGMRFSIYPYGTVFRAGAKPKGVIEIKRVEERRSQAQVIKQNLSDPVVTGDLLVNIAFDATGRKPTFVLVRFLDIDNDDEDDRDEIIQMIRDQGGKVLPVDPDFLSVDTDFIVMGEEWNEGVPKERQYRLRDNPVVDKALRRSVTQLDVDTFLNYIGYPKWK